MANSNGNFIKRKRSANWDALEKSLLKSCMKEFVSIIENKNTDTNTNKSKTIAWQKVMKSFSELNSRVRELAEVKQQWRTMKLDAKKNMSQVKTSIKCTGGGPKPLSPDPETIDILSMIPQEFETDSNVFDSDSITNPVVQSQEQSLVNTPTQDYFITPGDNNENVQENITPLPLKMPTEIVRRKRKLTFNDVNDNKYTAKREERDLTRERNHILVSCIKEEHGLKMKNMLEAHNFIKEEHNLKIQQMLLEKEETQLRVEKLKLEILLLKTNLPQ
ncbi:unnamed protein product [Parnassius mnemosyne]|uniref:Regulatory protein zeste n=1 Tax=Parnassius mnemosyne TaxID=213953 RepID=A0AAV1M1Z7_9NEOP